MRVPTKDHYYAGTDPNILFNESVRRPWIEAHRQAAKEMGFEGRLFLTLLRVHTREEEDTAAVLYLIVMPKPEADAVTVPDA